MKLITCKNCKHWERGDKRFDPRTPEGTIEPGTWGMCGLASSSGGEASHRGTAFVAQDYESYSAHLNTHKDFGCNQGEKKT